MDTQTKAAVLFINFSLLEASIHLPTGATYDTLAAKVEVISWPPVVRARLCTYAPPERHGLSRYLRAALVPRFTRVDTLGCSYVPAEATQPAIYPAAR